MNENEQILKEDSICGTMYSRVYICVCLIDESENFKAFYSIIVCCLQERKGDENEEFCACKKTRIISNTVKKLHCVTSFLLPIYPLAVFHESTSQKSLTVDVVFSYATQVDKTFQKRTGK